MLKNSSVLKIFSICLVFSSILLSFYYYAYDKNQYATKHLFSNLEKQLRHISTVADEVSQKIKEDPSFEDLDTNHLNSSLKIPLRSYLESNKLDRISLIDNNCFILGDSSDNSAQPKDCSYLKKIKSFFLIKDEKTIIFYHLINLSFLKESQKSVDIFTETLIDAAWLNVNISNQLVLKSNLPTNQSLVESDVFLQHLEDYFESDLLSFQTIAFNFTNKKDLIFICLIFALFILLFLAVSDYLNEAKRKSLSKSFSKNFLSLEEDRQNFYGDITLKEKDWKDLMLKIDHLKQDFSAYKDSTTKENHILKEKNQSLNLLYHDLSNQKTSSELSEKLKIRLSDFEKQIQQLSSNKHSLSSETLRSSNELKHIISSWQDGITSMGAFRFIRTLSQDFATDDFQKITQLETDLSQINSLNQNLVDTSLRYALLVEDFFEKVGQIKELVEE